jgi:hypothetical protein
VQVRVDRPKPAGVVGKPASSGHGACHRGLMMASLISCRALPRVFATEVGGHRKLDRVAASRHTHVLTISAALANW